MFLFSSASVSMFPSSDVSWVINTFGFVVTSASAPSWVGRIVISVSPAAVSMASVLSVATTLSVRLSVGFIVGPSVILVESVAVLV